jgi:hypothetical protein
MTFRLGALLYFQKKNKQYLVRPENRGTAFLGFF